MATIKVYLRKKKLNRVNEYPIYLRIIKDRRVKVISLGYSVKEKDWDGKTYKVKKSHPNAQRLNLFIANKIAEAEKIALDLETKKRHVKSQEIKDTLLGKRSESFSDYLDKYINELKIDNKYGTVGKATTLKSKLNSFAKNKNLYFDDITPEFLKQFERHLASHFNNSHNTIYTSIKLIRKLFNDAIRENIIALNLTPFRIYKFTWKAVKKCFLTEEELSKIELLSLPKNRRIWDCRNLFIFAVYAAGLRISDVLQLKKRDFNNGSILVRTQKTGQTISIFLPDKALSILTYYFESEDANEYIFPFLDSRVNNNEKQLHQAIASYNAFINSKLKEIAKAAEIEKNISFHTSRHTFATLALKRGIRIEYVSRLMAHTTIKTTQIYAKIINSELDNAMKVLNLPTE